MTDCICFITPEKSWTTHYGAVEPGSQMEPNYACPVHFPDADYRTKLEFAIWQGVEDVSHEDTPADLVSAIVERVLAIAPAPSPNAAIVAHANDTLTMVAGILGDHEHRAKTPDGTINTKAARCVECGELLLLSHRLNEAGFLRWITWDEYNADPWPTLPVGEIAEAIV